MRRSRPQLLFPLKLQCIRIEILRGGELLPTTLIAIVTMTTLAWPRKTTKKLHRRHVQHGSTRIRATVLPNLTSLANREQLVITDVVQPRRTWRVKGAI